MKTVAKFERGERVKVVTDMRPRPTYVILAVDSERSLAKLVQVGTGFNRTVGLGELIPELTA